VIPFLARIIAIADAYDAMAAARTYREPRRHAAIVEELRREQGGSTISGCSRTRPRGTRSASTLRAPPTSWARNAARDEAAGNGALARQLFVLMSKHATLPTALIKLAADRVGEPGYAGGAVAEHPAAPRFRTLAERSSTEVVAQGREPEGRLPGDER